MDEKQTVLTALEISNLENMYIGDKARDARSKIRGFLFQDLVMDHYSKKLLTMQLTKHIHKQLKKTT